MSIAGAVTALGDTLFPPKTLVEGFESDFSSSANFLVRLRVWHPVLATIVGFYLYYLTRHLRERYRDLLKHNTNSVIIIFGTQLAAGTLNLILLVPIWMQIVHLFLTTLAWFALTLLVVETKTIIGFVGGDGGTQT